MKRASRTTRKSVQKTRTSASRKSESSQKTRKSDIDFNVTVRRRIPKSNTNNAQIRKIEENMITTEEFVPYYDKRFPDWITQTYQSYKKEADKKRRVSNNKNINNKNNNSNSADTGFTPFSHQKLVRDYMASPMSPYRGLLLYHGLGSGKTCASIMISEGLIKLHNKKCVVLIPASLRGNFIAKGLEFCADDRYKTNQKWERNYTFVSYNASNVKKQVEALGSFDDKVVIIEEVHNLVSRITSSLLGNSVNGRYIYEKLMEAKNCKIIALSGTPLINTPAELAILFNILRGNIEMTVFRIMEIGNKRSTNRLEKVMSEIDGIDYVDLRLGNKTVEVHIQAKTWMSVYNEKIDEILETVEEKLGIELKKLTIRNLKLFPDTVDGGEFRDFYRYFVDEDNEGMMRLKNRDLFQRRIVGLISHYYVHDDTYPEVIHKGLIEVPMSDHQFEQYMVVREEERSREFSAAKKRRVGMEAKTMFRVFSREFSNFVFPDAINRPFPNPTFEKTVRQALAGEENKNKLERNLRELDDFEKNYVAEMEANDGAKISKRYQQRIVKALADLEANADQFLTLDALNTYSPKMKTIMETIQTSPGTVFVYTQFTLLEGVQIFAKVLEANGYEQFRPTTNNRSSQSEGLRYALYTGNITFEERNDIIEVFNSPENKTGDLIRVLIASSAGAEGLDLKNIRQVHIMEPYWNEVKMDQVVGRAVRRESHFDLPRRERNVEVYRYLATMTVPQQQRMTEEQSTDQHVYSIALKKKLLTNELLQVLRETSIDCQLNAADNMRDREYKCFSFESGATGMAYLPDISYDIYSNVSKVERKITVSLVVGLISIDDMVYFAEKETKNFFIATDMMKKKPLKKKPKIKQKVYIDLANRKIYDYKLLRKGQKVVIGTFNNDAQFIIT
jgi:SNF2 family DNA or RNA helicase